MADEGAGSRTAAEAVGLDAGQRRVRRQWALVTFAVVLVSAACLGVGIYVKSLVGPSHGDLERAAESLALPPEFHLIEDGQWGNAMCFDSCVTVDRRYSSPLGVDPTRQAVAAALTRAGHECRAGCKPEEGFSPTWYKGDKPEYGISFLVWSKAARLAANEARGPDAGPIGKVEPGRDTYLDLDVMSRVGSPN